MAYDGYLRLNGIELANAARTTRYVDNLLPMFGLKGCQDCEGLEAALGATYTTPMVDQAPWFDPSMPSSGSFYGFYPLSIDGIDDSTRTAVTTELVGDGSITNRPRFAGRDILVNGLLIGATEQAVETGMAWLNRALSGPCGGSEGCLGSDLDFYSSCPAVQDWSTSPIYPLDWLDQSLGNEVALWTPSGVGSFVTAGTPGQLGFNTATAGDYFTRQVSGLIPGETYRMTMFGTDGAEGVRATIVEGSEFTFDFHHIIGGAAPDDLQQPLDFVAPSDVITIRLQSWDFETDAASTSAFSIARLTVQRTEAFATVLQTEYTQIGTPTGGWSASVETGTTVEPWQRIVSESRVYTTVIATTGTVSYPSGAYIARDIQNTGVTTRVTVAGVFTEDTYAGSIAFSMSGATNVSTVYSHIDTTTPTQVKFIASLEFDFATPGVPATIFVETTAATTIGSTIGAGAEWSVHYLFVESVDEPLLIEDPNPGLALERVLRQVVATSGPVTAERFSPPCGAMRRVTFSLRAGVPFHYGSPAVVGNAFGSEAAAIPQVECIEGQAVTYNYFRSPRLLTTTNWSYSGWTSEAFGSSVGDPSGTNVQLSGGTTTGTITFTSSLAGVPALIEDAPYTFGVFLKNLDATTAMTVDTISLTIAGTTNVVTLDDEPETIPPVDADSNWYPITITGVAPAAAGSFAVVITITRPSGASLDMSAPIFTFGTSIAGYDEPWKFGDPQELGWFSGESENAAWVGTMDDSASLLTPAPEAIVYDPACPVLPDPPAPPTIDDSCLVLPESWLRYTIDVPSRFIPVTSSAEPIMTINTTTALNNVRMRFYPADLGPFAMCGFTGEMLLSYIPANSTVILDATQRTATLVRVGFEDQSVTHLLYGPDGGPIQWPDLSCGQAYIFTVDVEPTGDISGSEVELEMAVKY